MMKIPGGKVDKIIIFRALQLGDMLCVIPAMRALRAAYPDAEITLAGLPWAKSFTERFSKYFDGFIHFPGYPGLPEQKLDPSAFIKFLSLVQEQEFDLAIQMQGDGSIVNPMVELFCARHTAGFSKEGHYASDNGLFMPYPDYGHEIERHLLLMQHLGIPLQGTDLEYPLMEQDYKAFDKLNLLVQSKRYICIHPGSRGSYRQWPVEHFAAIADYCMDNGYLAVITGTKEEADIVDSVIKKMHNKPLNTAGKTTLGVVGLLIKNSAMLVSNCTGVSHIATAFKTPSVVISMDGEPHRWAPMDKRVHRTINWLESPDFDAVHRETTDLMNLAG